MPDGTAIKEWLMKWGIFLAVAVFGGIAREGKDRLDGHSFRLWDFIARIVISCFAGLLVIFLTQEYDLSRNLTGAIAGIAGYAGVEGIDCAKRIVRSKVSL